MTAPLLDVRGVSKSYGVTVIDDLSVAVAEGDALGIVGPNGAGKTTLLNLIAGDEHPDAGTITFDGVDVTRQRADRRCHAGLARTAQVPRPFEDLTVFENVLVAAVFGSGRPAREREAVAPAVAALERTHLLDRANDRAGTLGLLSRKRLELARGLATRPRVLLLDEIAGGLTDGEVLDLIDDVKALRSEGMTIVWIEHVVHALLAVVDRMVAMSFGRRIAEGDPDEVMASPAVQEVYMGVAPE
ncbi:MAG TPA: ABC transporter ATP-binding protein [Acidimicrobiales bacterium]|nr:ABC transporter ATP-binding protein [Acidimicrobiales bacterium]